jgi:hypothetical protein
VWCGVVWLAVPCTTCSAYACLTFTSIPDLWCVVVVLVLVVLLVVMVMVVVLLVLMVLVLLLVIVLVLVGLIGWKIWQA